MTRDHCAVVRAALLCYTVVRRNKLCTAISRRTTLPAGALALHALRKSSPLPLDCVTNIERSLIADLKGKDQIFEDKIAVLAREAGAPQENNGMIDVARRAQSCPRFTAR